MRDSPDARAGHFYRFAIYHYQGVTSGRCDIRPNAKPRGVRLLTVCPRDQRCGKIRTGDVGKRIAAANARIDVDYVAAILGDKCDAVQNTDLAELLADQLANHLKSMIPHRPRSVQLPRPHPGCAL